MIYDLQWRPHPEYFNNHSEYQIKDIFTRPQNLEDMLKIASKLSKGLPQVRCDLYNIDGHIYFGEMTMTAHGGLMRSYTDAFMLELGAQITI